MPVLVQRDDLLILAGRFVVDHYVLCLRVLPEVVNGTSNQKISRLMEVLDTDKVLAPSIEVFVGYGDGVNAVLFHERVSGAPGPIKIKLLFKEGIDGRVQGEGISRGSVDSQPSIYVKAARAFFKKIDLAPAQFEGLRRARAIDVS